MRTFRILVALMLVIVGVVSTVGSGGGGGGGGDASFDIADCVGSPALPEENCQPSQPPEPVPDLITADNAQGVSATVVQSIEQLFDFATTMGGQIFPSPPSEENLLSGQSKYALFETVVVTGEPLTDACTVSGTLTVSAFNINDPALSVGDVFGLVYDACDDGDGYIIDGDLELKVWELEGDPRTDVFRLKYILLGMDLTVDSGMDAYTASSGTFFLEWDSLSFPVIVLTPEPDNSQLSSQDDIYFWYSGSSQPLTINADPSLTATLREASIAIMDSAFLGGNLTCETIIPLQAADDQGPESGEILISQTYRDGTIRMVIESSTSVRLEIDSDGDGTVEDTQFTTWAELQG